MHRDIIVIGASAGGLPALVALIRGLPASLQAAVLVVMHVRRTTKGVLPDVLQRASVLPVAFAEDGEEARYGRIYIARSDLHLLMDSNVLRLAHGPKENGFRPAIDPLFRTAARTFGDRVIGVVLSGALSDGASGLGLIKTSGGLALVQDPADAIVPNMPRNALSAVDVDHVVPAAEMGALLVRLTRDGIEGEWAMTKPGEIEPQLPTEETAVSVMQARHGAPSSLTCPDCGGALWEVVEGKAVRYQCHVGHRYSSDTLDLAQREAVESALWSAVRVLEERAELKMRLAARTADSGLASLATGFEDAARDAHRRAQDIRTLLLTTTPEAPLGPTPARRSPPVRKARVRPSAGTGRTATAADMRPSSRRAPPTAHRRSVKRR